MDRLLRNFKFFGYGVLLVALTALAVNSCSEPAHADIVTEFGAGYKLPQTTSYVLRPECHTVQVKGMIRSCGGDNPLFIGWPVAWEMEFRERQRIKRVRCGWFHTSHWGDGGSDRETHLDAAACTLTVVWRGR